MSSVTRVAEAPAWETCICVNSRTAPVTIATSPFRAPSPGRIPRAAYGTSPAAAVLHRSKGCCPERVRVSDAARPHLRMFAEPVGSLVPATDATDKSRFASAGAKVPACRAKRVRCGDPDDGAAELKAGVPFEEHDLWVLGALKTVGICSTYAARHRSRSSPPSTPATRSPWTVTPSSQPITAATREKRPQVDALARAGRGVERQLGPLAALATGAASGAPDG